MLALTVPTAIRRNRKPLRSGIRALQEELDSLRFTSDDLSLNVSGMGEGSHQVQPTLNRELDSAYDLLGISSCTVTVARGTGTCDGDSA